MKTQEINKTAANIKRTILIVEDNELNRDILSALLEDEYRILTAENGEEGIRLLSQYYDILSLIILDVFMPVCDGFEFLERTQSDKLLASVPVIVATGSNRAEDEVRCLHLGASDFVTKPYNPEVVLGRVHSIIKLKESMATLSAVEYDELTGLYTMPAFYHHVEKVLSTEKERQYHLAMVDMQGFKMINSIFGEKMGDTVLRYVAQCYRHILPNVIMARQGDKFYALYTDEDLPDAFDTEKHMNEILNNAPVPNLSAKLGVYKNVERNIAVSILCDRVTMAVSRIKRNFAQKISYYDEKIQKRVLEEQRMENEFETALEKEEFVIWYQPKVDTRTEKVVGAEALVRWIPEDGRFMSPGIFIPLFEQDGLISRLDEYVFWKVCRFQKSRINDGKSVVPISINLSRNSTFHADTVDRYAEIVDEVGISRSLVPIELTESASIDNREVQNLIDKFKNAGFALHMDDFGTGYSSLSSLTTLAFDVVKLDKSLTDRIGNDKGNTVIRHMINIAQEMGIKTVAEGVESRFQVDFLKKTGCDMIQGYYFSPPRDERLFEEIIDHLDDTITMDLDLEYRRLQAEMHTEFGLDEKTIHVIENIADGMMEGFFIYRAKSDENLIYANRRTLQIFGCESMQEFRIVTGNSFRGIVHPDEYEKVEKSIFKHISENPNYEYMEKFHIIRKDGSTGYVRNIGHCIHTEDYGNVFYVFMEETAESEN